MTRLIPSLPWQTCCRQPPVSQQSSPNNASKCQLKVSYGVSPSVVFIMDHILLSLVAFSTASDKEFVSVVISLTSDLTVSKVDISREEEIGKCIVGWVEGKKINNQVVINSWVADHNGSYCTFSWAKKKSVRKAQRSKWGAIERAIERAMAKRRRQKATEEDRKRQGTKKVTGNKGGCINARLIN